MEAQMLEHVLKASQDNDGNVRKAAAILLSSAGENPQVKTALVKLLKDKVWQVRERAIVSIGILKIEEAGDYLTSLLGATDDATARKAILTWAPVKSDPDDAGKKPGAGGGSPLGGAPKKKEAKEPWQLKKAAALALSRINPGIAANPLIGALAVENPSAKMAAMVGLANIGAEEAVEPLLGLMESEDTDVRKMAASCLGRLKAVAAVERLVAALEDAKAAVRIEVVIALNHIKPEGAIGPIAKCLLTDRNQEVRKVAATALGNLRDDSASEPLLQALTDDDPTVRKATIDALVNLRLPELRDNLIALLSDENEDVRAAASIGIIRLNLL